MNCKETRTYFNDYILGELDPSVEIRVNEHCAECRRCQNQLKEHEEVINLFKGSQRIEPAVKTRHRIQHLLPRLLKQKKKRSLFFTTSCVYAIAAFILGLVVMRTADVAFLRVQDDSKVETKYESAPKTPFADTVQFYSTPAENIVRI